MSGPVWRKVEDETVACDSCLATVASALVEGSVEECSIVEDFRRASKPRLCPSRRGRSLAARGARPVKGSCPSLPTPA